jgi:hypothetical protein
MARRSLRAELRPRVVTDAALAGYLGRSVSWLAEHRLELERQGFPQRLPAIGGNDLMKVDAWLDGLCAQQRSSVSPEIERLIAKATANVR